MNATNPTGPDADRVERVTARLRAAGCVFAEEEASLLIQSAADQDALESLVARRVAGLPLEQLLGWVDFGGLRLRVEPGVFVPRQRTLVMAELAVDRLSPGRVLLDLCCGVGAVAAVVADRVPDVRLLAADLDPVAARCAEQNLSGHRAEIFVGDLFRALPAVHRGRIDVLTANVPYVPTGEIDLMPPEARDHEPRAALDGGPDGLDLARRVIAGAAEWLAPGGQLLIEVSDRQAATAVREAERCGLTAVAHDDDERDTTVLVAAG